MRGSLLTAGTYLVGSVLFLCGCDSGPGGKPVDPKKNKTADTLQDDHDHGHGPHDGHIVELPPYHGEVVYDAKAKKVEVYILGADAKKPEPIEAESVALNLTLEGNPLQLVLMAKPLDGEQDGKSSHFELVGNEELAEHAKSIEDLNGKLNVKIGDKQHSGAVGHSHAGHGHGDHKGHDHADDHKDADHDQKEGEHSEADHEHKEVAHKDGEHEADHKHGDQKEGDHKEADHKDGEHKDADDKGADPEGEAPAPAK